jgi:hypothetical protein
MRERKVESFGIVAVRFLNRDGVLLFEQSEFKNA